MRALLRVVLGVVCAVGIGVGGLAATSSTTVATRPPGPGVVARSVAGRLLSGLRLPPGSRSVRLAGLAGPMASLGDVQYVDRSAAYRVAGSPAGVVAYLTAHPPPATRTMGSGFGSGTAWDDMVVFAPIRTSPEVAEAQLVVSLKGEGGGGTTLLRVDAEVMWQAPHPPAEDVPVGVPLATASLRQLTRVLRSVVVHRGVTLRRLVDAFDALPVAVPVARSCPSDVGTRWSVHFQGSPTVDAVESSCLTVTTTVDGHAGPVLFDGHRRLLDRLTALVGATTARVEGGGTAQAKGGRSMAARLSSSWTRSS